MKWLFSILLKPQIFSKKFIKSNFIPSNFEMKIWGFEGIERILFLPTHSIFSQLPNKRSEEYSKIIFFIPFQSIFFFNNNKKKTWWSFLCVSVCFAVFVPFGNASLPMCCNWFLCLEAKWCQSFNLRVDYTLLRKKMFFHCFTPFLFNGIMLILIGHSPLVLK